MTFHVDVSRQKKAFFLEILNSLNFVERVRFDEEEPQSDSDSKTPTQLSFFDRHHGSIPNLDVAAFEVYLEESRRG